MGIRVTDLMVGDWVLDTRTNNPLRVNPFLAETEVPEWQPIPLTEEILEKNGFKRTKKDFRFMQDRLYNDEDYEIGIDFVKSGICFWKGDSINIALKLGSRINNIPAYVHNLQHIFKLCGINKEIVL